MQHTPVILHATHTPGLSACIFSLPGENRILAYLRLCLLYDLSELLAVAVFEDL